MRARGAGVVRETNYSGVSSTACPVPGLRQRTNTRALKEGRALDPPRCRLEGSFQSVRRDGVQDLLGRGVAKYELEDPESRRAIDTLDVGDPVRLGVMSDGTPGARSRALRRVGYSQE